MRRTPIPEDKLSTADASHIVIRYRSRYGAVTEDFETTKEKRARTQALEALVGARLRAGGKFKLLELASITG